MKTLIKSYSYRPEGSRLTILAEFKDSTKRNRMVFCSCDCGNFSYTTKSKVTQLRSRSCGCLSSERSTNFGSNRKLNGNGAAINALIRSYERGAVNRNLDYAIEYDTFVELTTSNCTYCGAPPTRVYRARRSSADPYICNGIDRIDNSKGYIEGNVTPCCTTCNIIKSNYTIEELFRHLLKILEHSHVEIE